MRQLHRKPHFARVQPAGRHESIVITRVSTRRMQYNLPVSPTVFQAYGYRFYFFSREEDRLHVHVYHADGEAKFWLDPKVELATSHGLRDRQVAIALELLREHEDDIRKAWERHFGR